MTKADEEKARLMWAALSDGHNCWENLSEREREIMISALSQARAEAYADAARVVDGCMIASPSDELTREINMHMENAIAAIEAKAKEVGNG